MTLALMLVNELPSVNIIDLRSYHQLIASGMVGTMALGLIITLIHIIKEVRHVSH